MASLCGAFIVLVVLCSSLLVQSFAAKPLVPAMFVFGDSLVDVGNNNHLPNVNGSCKANFRRYGIDYPCGHLPTGRFSNGYNLADQLAQLLGFDESPPPFFSLKNATFAQLTSTGGINFASGGSGLFPTTGGIKLCGGQVVSMAQQVGSFTGLVQMWESEKKLRRAAADLISKSLFFISVGSNDLFEYSDHFVDPKNRHDVSRNDTQFLQGLVAAYTIYVKALYDAGATKFSVVSPSLVGCCPLQRRIAKASKDVGEFGCLATANNLSRKLYPMIDCMLKSLSAELPGMSYSLGDAISMAEWIFNNPITPDYNFSTLDRACCGSGDFNASACTSSAPVCPHRSSFFFWDRFHPTETASGVTAKQLFRDNGAFVRPVNVQQLVASTSSSRP